MNKIEKYKKKYGLKDDKETLFLIKSQSPRFKEYWIAKGYSEEEAKLELQKRNPSYKSYWIANGYSEEDAEFEIRKKLKKCKEYWISNGYSEKEAIELAKKYSLRQNKANKQYWIDKGYSEEEAIELAEKNNYNKYPHTTCKKTSNKLCKQYWITKGYSEEEAIELAKNANRNATKNISTETHRLAAKLGNSKISKERKNKINKDKSLLMKSKNKTHSPIFKEYWIAKGYSEDEAKIQVFNTKFSSQNNISRASKIELKFFEELDKFLSDKNILIKRQKWVRINEKNYCQDGRYDNFVIEFNGTNFHLDDRFYNNNSKNPVGVSFNDVKERDFLKIQAYLQREYNIIVVWEYDYLNHKEKLFEIIRDKLINESNKKGSYWNSAGFFNKC